MYYEKQQVFVRHRDGLRQYPFSFVTLVNSAGVVVGSGFAPDGDAIRQDGCMVDDMDVAVIKEPVVDPYFLGRAEQATGIR